MYSYQGIRSFRRILLFLAILVGGKVIAGPGDSVTVNSGSPQGYKSLIGGMTAPQLVSLVDFLLELDTIPLDLLKEVQKAIAAANPTRSKASLVPASELYSTWEVNNLFPAVDMLNLRGDTSMTLSFAGSNANFVLPSSGPMTSGFGWRDSAQHNGIDIDLNKGDKVVAAFDGMVRIAKRNGGFGNVVIIRHYNGLETVYAHLHKIKVKTGEVVSAGQTIGLGGNTGHSTGTHLHFEVRLKGVPLNPKYLISFNKGELLSGQFLIRKSKHGLAVFPSDQKKYIVEKGDSLFEIAKHFGTSTATIRELNGLTGRSRLKPGQEISVRR
jgi:murein DD-endopeptidase MepM/ murein hydrolase activator NlpD